MNQKQYHKKEKQIVLGVQLNLETDGFKYTKWGNEQQCRAGDWLVNNDGECYTVNEQSFRNTYEEVAPGQFVKTAKIWASVATEGGKVKTKEGYSNYAAGDYFVSNEQDGSDTYVVSKAKFEAMYEMCN